MNEPLTRYLNRLIGDFRRLDSRGVMQMARIVEMDLREVYIPLKLKLELPERQYVVFGAVIPDSDGSPRFSQQIAGRGQDFEVEYSGTGHDLWRFPANTRADLTLDDLLARPGLASRSRRWVILGDPGAGKTTLLRHRAVQTAQTLMADEQDSGFFPVFITLRYFGAWLEKHPAHDAGDALLDYWVAEGLAEFGLTELADRQAVREAIEYKLRTGGVLFLLDGLDEQRDAAAKTATAEAIRVLDQRCHGNTWLVTSRIVGYGGALGRLFDEATVQPFTPEDRDRYLRRWFLAVEQREDPVCLLARRRGETAEPDEFTRQTARRKAHALIEQIDAIPGIRELAANPLLCTIVGLIFLQGGTLPESRAELYKLCVDTFIFNWEMHKRRKPQEGPQLNKEETQAVLEAVALHFHEHCPENRAGRAALVLLVESFLVKECGETSATAKAKAEHLLTLITEVAGLLIDRGNDEYGFFHLSFQEYLAARRMTASRRRWREYLSRYCFDPRWREVIRLAAIHQGSKDAESGSEFVEAVWHVKPAPPHDDIMQYRFRFAFLLMREARVERETADRLWMCWAEILFRQPNLSFLLFWLFDKPGKSSPCPKVVLDRLIAALNEKNSKLREMSAIALGLTGDRRASAPLISALMDGSPELRQVCLGSLKKIADPDSEKAIILALENEDYRVRACAADALGKFKSERAMIALRKALMDSDFLVKFHASRALKVAIPGFIQTKSGEGPIPEDFIYSRMNVTLLIDNLSSLDVSVRLFSARELGKRKAASTCGNLTKLLHDETLSVRLEAIRALGAIGSSQAIGKLIALLRDEHPLIRSTTAQALGETENPILVDELLRLLDDTEFGVSQASALAIEKLDLGARL